MRGALLFIVAFILMCSCRKSVSDFSKGDVDENYADSIRSRIEKILSDDEIDSLDFSKVIRSNLVNGKIYVRIAFRNISLSEKYLHVITDSKSEIFKVAVIEITGLNIMPDISEKQYKFECKIIIRDLIKDISEIYWVKNGQTFRLGHTSFRTDVEEAPDTDVNQDLLPDNYLPPVIVVGYIHSDFGGGVGFTYFIGTPGIESSAGLQVVQTYDPVTGVVGNQLLEIEMPVPKPKTDLKKMFACFAGVSSYGAASYTVTLCADLPVNGNSNAYFNLSFSPGHSFLTLTKANAGEQISQSVGFYPGDDGAIGQMRDNGLNEYNASITMNLSEQQFGTLLQKIESLSSRAYDLSDFNCTDFALQAFNSIRAVPIAVSSMEVYVGYPGANPSALAAFSANSSPQALFNKLNEMKSNGGSEANNITIDRSHNSKAPQGHGECN